MSQSRQHMFVRGNNGTQFGDTTYTKIFVGGLAWETQTDTLKSYFEQFGEILEAVVITDKVTRRSRGYGFVTFKNPDSAMRACHNSHPVIDGRRTNCNLASFGAQKFHPKEEKEQFGLISKSTTQPSSLQSTSTPYFKQPYYQYGFPYIANGYPNYAHDISQMTYYSVYGGQHFPFYYNYYPLYPKLARYPYLSQHNGLAISSPPISALPSMAASDREAAGTTSAAETLETEHTIPLQDQKGY